MVAGVRMVKARSANLANGEYKDRWDLLGLDRKKRTVDAWKTAPKS